MNGNLLQYIELNRSSFSKGQRAIADYIADNYDKAAFMTASVLGKTVGVSESTVVRFAAILGYDGYPGLQYALQELIKNKLTAVQRLQVAKNRFGGDVLKSVISADTDNIKRTLEDVSGREFQNTVDRISVAENIYILGSGGAASLASFLFYYLDLALSNVRLVQTLSTSEMLEQLVHLKKNDLLIGISFPRYSKRTVKAFTFAKEKGAGVIAITDSPASPIAKQSDVLLTARSNMVGYIDSLVAPMSLINALVAAVSLKKQPEVSDALTQLEQIWERYDIYAKPEENIQND